MGQFCTSPFKMASDELTFRLVMATFTSSLTISGTCKLFAELLAQLGGYSASMVAGAALLDYSRGRLPSSESTHLLAEGKHCRAFIMFFHWRSPFVSISLFIPAPTVEAGLSASEGKLWKKSSRQTGSFSLPQINLLKIHREYVDASSAVVPGVTGQKHCWQGGRGE